jgi:shikimate kinase
MSPRVVLVGVPGAGKSTVGRLLARKLGVEFRDTDTDVEAVAGMPITDIFVTLGEPAFRKYEEDAVAAALSEHSGVLSLGGGAVLSERTRALLTDQPVVWLEVDLTNATQRVGLNQARPLLLGNVRGTMKKLLDDRAPFYESVATWRVDTTDKTPVALASEIAELVGS